MPIAPSQVYGGIMSKTALLAATAVVAVTAGHCMAGPNLGPVAKAANIRPIPPKANILYTQNKDYGYAIISQNFSSQSQDNAAAADDFVVPAGKTWKVTEVDVEGQYFEGTGPAKSEVITFSRNDNGHPRTG